MSDASGAVGSAPADATPHYRVLETPSGARLAYAEYGTPTGRPVLFLHGTPGSRLGAAPFDGAAAHADVRLIAVDRPGFGRSAPWPEPPAGDRLVDAVLDGLDLDGAAAIAFSGASRHALAARSALGDRLDRVDVVSGAVPPDVRETPPTQQRVLETLATRTPRLLGGLLRVQALLATQLGPDLVVDQYTTGQPGEAVTDEVAETVAAEFREALAESRTGTVTELRETASEWSVGDDDDDDGRADLHWWHGTRDSNVPIEGVRRLADERPQMDLHVRRDADHLGTLLEAVPDVLSRRA